MRAVSEVIKATDSFSNSTRKGTHPGISCYSLWIGQKKRTFQLGVYYTSNRLCIRLPTGMVCWMLRTFSPGPALPFPTLDSQNTLLTPGRRLEGYPWELWTFHQGRPKDTNTRFSPMKSLPRSPHSKEETTKDYQMYEVSC